MAMPKPKRTAVKELVVTIGNSQYRLKKSASCKGCEFEYECYAIPRKRECPTLNGHVLAQLTGSIYKKLY